MKRYAIVGSLTGVLLAACNPPAEDKAQTAAPSTAHTDKVLFEDDHIRVVEVLNRPGERRVEAIPYHSVLFTDAAWPTVTETPRDWTAASGEVRSAPVAPKDNRPYPWCRTQGPQAARTVSVQGDFPQHYYRIDYKRIDGADFAANWKTWYKDVFGPPSKVVADPGDSLINGKPFSPEWPYDIGYSPTIAAPANHTVRYEDDHIEMVEVAIREGEAENMHGHPYPSVYADDGGFAPAGSVYKNVPLGQDVGPPWGKLTAPAEGPTWPVCFSAVPEPPHSVAVQKGPPQHFYRIHFKRVDGDAIKTDWAKWYPAG